MLELHSALWGTMLELHNVRTVHWGAMLELHSAVRRHARTAMGRHVRTAQ